MLLSTVTGYHVYTDSADIQQSLQVLPFSQFFWVGSGDKASWDPCSAFAYGGARSWSGIFTVGILMVQVYVVEVLCMAFMQVRKANGRLFLALIMLTSEVQYYIQQQWLWLTIYTSPCMPGYSL